MFTLFVCSRGVPAGAPAGGNEARYYRWTTSCPLLNPLSIDEAIRKSTAVIVSIIGFAAVHAADGPPVIHATHTKMSPALAIAARALTLAQAHEIALKKNPKITIAHLLALASWQAVTDRPGPVITRMSRSISRSVQGEGKYLVALDEPACFRHCGSRWSRGVREPAYHRLWPHSNLTASSVLKAKAGEQNVEMPPGTNPPEVDSAYFAYLRNQVLVRVARGTVTERRLLRNQRTPSLKMSYDAHPRRQLR